MYKAAVKANLVRANVVLFALLLSTMAHAQLAMTVGSSFIVNTSTLNVRDAPGTTAGNVIGQENQPATARVANATPYYADGLWWWEAIFDTSGLRGWVAQGYPDDPWIVMWTPGTPLPLPPEPDPVQLPAQAVEAPGPRAWQTINFGDSRETVRSKVSDLMQNGTVSGSSAAIALLFMLETDLGGLDVEMVFEFVDDRLHRLTFDGREDSHQAVEFDYNTLRDIQVAAHGNPGQSRAYYLLRPDAGFIQFGGMWRRNGVLYRVGIGRRSGSTSAEFYSTLHLEWEELSEEIIRDAADGF